MRTSERALSKGTSARTLDSRMVETIRENLENKTQRMQKTFRTLVSKMGDPVKMGN